MKNPLVSIITVVYNGEKYLQQTIDSVKNQTYTNIEYIVIDGGSKDNTLSIIQENADNISYWISEPDKGLYDAMNKGIKIAKGEIIGIINSDDWYELDAVDIMIKAYINHPTKTIFHADRYDIDENQKKSIKKYDSSKFKFKYYGMMYNHPTMFITSTEYKKHLYNTELIALSDYQFVLEAFLNNKDTFHYIEKPIVNYRLDGVSGVMPLNKALKEGYISRKNAGMNMFQNLFSLCLRYLKVKLQNFL